MNELLHWIFDKLWLALGGLVGWLWYASRQEIADLKAAIAKKADQDEMTRQRNNIEKLFDEQTLIRKEMSKGFEDVKDAINRGNVEIIRELARKQDR
jgi:hypothetical protein